MTREEKKKAILEAIKADMDGKVSVVAGKPKGEKKDEKKSK